MHDKPGEQCMINYVISAWSVMWPVHGRCVIIAWSAMWAVHNSHVISAWSATRSVHDIQVISAWSVTWYVCDQPRDQCMLSTWSVQDSHVVTSWLFTWSIHNQSRDMCVCLVPQLGGGSHFLLQGIFLTQESSLCLLHCRQILYQLSYLGSPVPQYLSYKFIKRYWRIARIEKSLIP